jgi:hypothetical protein
MGAAHEGSGPDLCCCDCVQVIVLQDLVDGTLGAQAALLAATQATAALLQGNLDRTLTGPERYNLDPAAVLIAYYALAKTAEGETGFALSSCLTAASAPERRMRLPMWHYGPPPNEANTTASSQRRRSLMALKSSGSSLSDDAANLTALFDGEPDTRRGQSPALGLPAWQVQLRLACHSQT